MKDNKFLKWYACIIIVILILIMFVLPDNFYLDLQTKFNIQEIKNTETKKIEFVDLEKQKENLLNKDYEYEYLMLDSIGINSITAECTGKIVDGNETGKCISPKEISYTSETKKDAILQLNIKYIDLEYIFNSIKDIEPIEVSYTKTRELIYKTKILDLDTDITIYTDIENITQISISNAYMTYVFKYNNMKD